MTYEERLKHRDLSDRSARLRERIEAGEDGAPLERDDARELVAIVEEILAQLSPDRWDRLMENIVDEAARRAGSVALIK